LTQAGLAEHFELCVGRISYQDALRNGQVTLAGVPGLVGAFPGGFGSGWRGAPPWPAELTALVMRL